MEERQSDRPLEGLESYPDGEEDQRVVVESGRQSGVRLRVPFVRENLDKRRIAIHFFVSQNGGVRHTGCVERIVHASGCTEYLGPAALRTGLERGVKRIAQGQVWEWAKKNTGPVAINFDLHNCRRKGVVHLVHQPKPNPHDGILCDLVPPVDLWLLEAVCEATTTKQLFKDLLVGLVTDDPVPQLGASAGSAVLHSFEEENRIGRVLLSGSSRADCRRLADEIWARLPIIKQRH